MSSDQDLLAIVRDESRPYYERTHSSSTENTFPCLLNFKKQEVLTWRSSSLRAYTSVSRCTALTHPVHEGSSGREGKSRECSLQ